MQGVFVDPMAMRQMRNKLSDQLSTRNPHASTLIARHLGIAEGIPSIQNVQRIAKVVVNRAGAVGFSPGSVGFQSGRHTVFDLSLTLKSIFGPMVLFRTCISGLESL